MKILGLDPGTATTGFAVIEKQEGLLSVLDYGVITTSNRLLDEERLLEIADNLEEILDQYEPELVAVESLFFFKNQKTAMSVSQARGVILLSIARRGIPVKEITPLQVKQAVTGHGQADKKQIQKMVQQIYSLEKIPKPDDAADALALAYAVS